MKIKIDKNIQGYLEEFSLSEREVAIYLSLLKTGPNTIMNLARETGIKRSTTHNNVEELIKKGLVSQTNYGERRMVVAEDPEKLKFLLEQKKWRMRKLEDNLNYVIQDIKKMVPENTEKSKVEVRYYEGEKNVSLIYEESTKADEVYSFINLDKYYEVFPDTEEMFNKAFDDNPNRKVYDIAVDSPLAKKIATETNERYFCKFIPSDAFYGADLLMYDNKLAIMQLDKENIICAVIDSKIIYESLKALHNLMWKMLSEVQKPK